MAMVRPHQLSGSPRGGEVRLQFTDASAPFYCNEQHADAVVKEGYLDTVAYTWPVINVYGVGRHRVIILNSDDALAHK
jgi:hypothetical protein